MTKDKKLRIGSIIADVILFVFLAIIVLVYLINLGGVKSGVDTNYAEGHMIYGIEAFLWNMLICGKVFIGTSVGVWIILYDVMFLIKKWGRNTLKKYQLIVIIATFVLIIVGIILCGISANVDYIH